MDYCLFFIVLLWWLPDHDADGADALNKAVGRESEVVLALATKHYVAAVDECLLLGSHLLDAGYAEREGLLYHHRIG